MKQRVSTTASCKRLRTSGRSLRRFMRWGTSGSLTQLASAPTSPAGTRPRCAAPTHRAAPTTPNDNFHKFMNLEESIATPQRDGRQSAPDRKFPPGVAHAPES